MQVVVKRASTSALVRRCVAFLFLLSCYWASGQQEFQVRVNLDVYSFLPSTISLIDDLGDQAITFRPVGWSDHDGLYEYKGRVDRFGNADASWFEVAVRLDAHAPRHTRIDLSAAAADPGEAGVDVDMSLHLLDTSVKITASALEDFVEDNAWEHDPVFRDQALALFGGLMEHVNPANGYDTSSGEMIIHWNYARALYWACLTGQYSTCDEAVLEYQAMLPAFDEEIGTIDSVSREMVTDARDQVLRHRANQRWVRVDRLTSLERTDPAAGGLKLCVLGDILDEEFPEHEAIWNGVGRPAGYVHADAGNAGLRFARRIADLMGEDFAEGDLRAVVDGVACVPPFLEQGLGIDSVNTVANRIRLWVLGESKEHYARAIAELDGGDLLETPVYSRDLLEHYSEMVEFERARGLVGDEAE